MKEINNYIEHTLLNPAASLNEIRNIADEAIKYNFFGVCINPCYIKAAKEFLKGKDIKIITTVNFPLASNTVETTLFQTEQALKDGADEIDTVINIAEIKNKNYKKVQQDIKKTKEIARNNILKVILETDLLTKEEIVIASNCAIEGGANFVKTSTGFVKNGIGATVENVRLMYKTVNPCGLEVKASGGIRTKEAAIELINAGASRLGTSSGVVILNS